MVQFQSLFVFLLPFATVAWAKFSNPDVENGEKPVWTVGDRQVVAWESNNNYPNDVEVNVTLWQQYPDGKDGAKNIALVYSSSDLETQVSEFDWIVQPYGANLGFSSEFFFWQNRDAVKGGFTSTYFNIKRSDDGDEDGRTATTSATATETSSPSESATASTDSDSDSDSGLTSTDKIALGVGLGVGIPILAALGVLIWLKARGGASVAAAASSSNQPGAGAASVYHPPPAELEQPPPVPKEVPGSPVYYHSELPGQKAR